MVAPVEGDETGRRNQRRHAPAFLEGHDAVVAHVHHERRGGYPARPVGDFDLGID